MHTVLTERKRAAKPAIRAHGRSPSVNFDYAAELVREGGLDGIDEAVAGLKPVHLYPAHR